MAIRIETNNQRGQAILSGEVTIYFAAQLMPQLLTLLHRSQVLEIDLGGISDFDSAGIQLLALIRREAELAGKPIQFVNHSESVLEALAVCGLNRTFNEASVVG